MVPAMAWTNSNWITFTGNARLVALRQFIKEIQDALTVGASVDGASVNPGTLQPMLAGLMAEESRLSEALVGAVFSVPTRRRY